MNNDLPPAAAAEDEADFLITLGVLNSVEANKLVSQRSIAQELDVALGLVNAYLKRCVTKGFVKISQVPRNRYAYYLTPCGFAEKSRLTAQYLQQSLAFFRRARNECTAIFELCRDQGWRDVVLVGCGDLADIAALCVQGLKAPRLLGVIDIHLDAAEGGILPLLAMDALARADAVVITDIKSPQHSFQRIATAFPVGRILAPELLRLSRQALNPGLDA